MKLNRFAIPLACVLPIAIASCGGIQNVPVNDLEMCGAALMAAGTTNPAVLFAVAMSNASCMRLTADVLSPLIGNVAAQQRARGVR